MPCAHACRRALLTAAVTFRLLRSPPAAISLSARHAVGTDATGPNSSRWSPITRKSLITRAPSAIAHARSARTRPRSWPPSGEGSAADSPDVRPVRSVSWRLLRQFPFRILGFHSDNGSEFINHIVAELLHKLLIEQTK